MAKAVAKTGAWRLEIVKRPDLHRFVVLPKRWILERTFAGMATAVDSPKTLYVTPAKAAAFIRLAMIRIMLRRIAAKRSA
jgi:transposase